MSEARDKQLPNWRSLTGTIPEYFTADDPDLLRRWEPVGSWLDDRLAHDLDPYNKANIGRIGPTARLLLRNKRLVTGVNFASQDYLNLSSHPRVLGAAKMAIDRYGVHSAGSAALSGNTAATSELEHELSVFLGYRDCTVFPTGWGAGYGAIRTLVTPRDHVVIDALSHACLREGARCATANVHTFPHLSNEAVERRLRRIRTSEPKSGILVVTEGLFSMDSDVPDLAELVRVCRQYGATLMVDVAHDLGALGRNGHGSLGEQEVLGQVDIVMGSFSKVFASNGGFVASNSSSLKLGLRLSCGPLTFTNALSPVQVAVVRESLKIVCSDEGARLRGALRRNSLALRSALSEAGFELVGIPTAIVPVLLGDQQHSRAMTRFSLERGGLVNLVEYPAVSRGSSRWRLQVMAHHRLKQIRTFVDVARAARDDAAGWLAAAEKDNPRIAAIRPSVRSSS